METSATRRNRADAKDSKDLDIVRIFFCVVICRIKEAIYLVTNIPLILLANKNYRFQEWSMDGYNSVVIFLQEKNKILGSH